MMAVGVIEDGSQVETILQGGRPAGSGPAARRLQIRIGHCTPRQYPREDRESIPTSVSTTMTVFTRR